MRFNILERIMILGILPKEADFISQKIIMDLRSSVGFSQHELDEHKIKVHEDGNISWEKDFEKEIKVTKRAAEIIINGLKELDKQKKVKPELMSIFEKFHVDIEIPKDIDEEYVP